MTKSKGPNRNQVALSELIREWRDSAKAWYELTTEPAGGWDNTDEAAVDVWYQEVPLILPRLRGHGVE